MDRILKKVPVLFVVTVFFMITIVSPAMAAVSNGTITRTYSASTIAPNGTVTVTLTPSPANLFDLPGYQVVEIIPAVFTVTTDPGISVAANLDNVWTFTQIGNSPIIYTVTAPAGTATGPNTFSGTFKDDDANTGTVGGAATLTIAEAVLPPQPTPTLAQPTQPAPTQPAPAAVLSAIAVSPGSITVIAGNTETFTATPKDQFGNPIAATVTWSSSNPSAGTIDAAGVFTALAAGTTTITAASGGISGQVKVTVIPRPSIVDAAYNFTNATTAQNSNVTVAGKNITADNPLNNTELIDLGANGNILINIAVSQTNNRTGIITSVILDAPVVNVNNTLNRSANIDLNLNSSVWASGNLRLNLQPANLLNETLNADAAKNATKDIDAALIALGKSTASKDVAIVIRATLVGIHAEDVVSLPISMTVDAAWFENKAGRNPDNVILFKINDTTGKVRDMRKPDRVSAKDIINNTYTFTFVMEGFSTFALTGTPSRPSGGGGGGGVGSGGVISNENFANIEKQESKDVSVNAGPIIYRFTTLDIVKEIGFDARTNEGLVTAKIELLKDRPKLATAGAPGIVYRYFNVWIGTAEYGSSTKIENAYVVFSVPEDWLKTNNVESVKLMKFRDGSWIDLKTEKAGDAYKGFIPGFAGFAVVGESRAQAAATTAASPAATPAITGTSVMAPTAVPAEKVPGFELVLPIAALSALYMFGRKRR